MCQRSTGLIVRSFQPRGHFSLPLCFTRNAIGSRLKREPFLMVKIPSASRPLIETCAEGKSTGKIKSRFFCCLRLWEIDFDSNQLSPFHLSEEL